MYYTNIADYEALLSHKNKRRMKSQAVDEENNTTPVLRNVKHHDNTKGFLLRLFNRIK